jgi:hypothetical protein
MNMLAQAQLDAVPSGYVKWFFVCLAAVFIVAAAIVGIVVAFRKPEPQKLNDDPPIQVQKAAKRYNHDLAEARYGELTRRADGHDAEIEQLWTTMRDEDSAIRKENGAKFDSILLALGEIKGELKNKK